MPFHHVDMSLYESTQESCHRYLKALCTWSPDLVKNNNNNKKLCSEFKAQIRSVFAVAGSGSRLGSWCRTL